MLVPPYFHTAKYPLGLGLGLGSRLAHPVMSIGSEIIERAGQRGIIHVGDESEGHRCLLGGPENHTTTILSLRKADGNTAIVAWASSIDDDLATSYKSVQ